MPRTEAGKRLIGHWASHSGPVVPTIDRVQVLIDAIEAEACHHDARWIEQFTAWCVAAERARIRAAVEESDELGRAAVSLVLAILDREDTDAS